MARIRTFKPDFATDAKVARLSRDARLTFLLLFTEADDEGRMVGTAKRLAGALYPHDEDVTPKKLDKWIGELVSQQMVQDYEVDGVRYLWIVNFAKHQKIDHKTDSRLPEPPPDDPGGIREPIANGATNGSRTAGEGVAPDLGSGSGSGSGSGTLSADAPSGERAAPDFDDFWQEYPRRVDKGHARTAWTAATRKAEPAAIVAGAARLAHDPNLPAEKFIPHPATWLRGERWDDGPLPSLTSRPSGNGALELYRDIRSGRIA